MGWSDHHGMVRSPWDDQITMGWSDHCHMGTTVGSHDFYMQAVEEEDKMTTEQLAVKNIGKQVCPGLL